MAAADTFCSPVRILFCSELVLDDPDLRKTNFVLLHGGAGPYSKEVAQLLMKPNVYTDLAEQTWLLPRRELSKSIRYWLEWYPEKVMFGTDLYPGDWLIRIGKRSAGKLRNRAAKPWPSL